MSIAVLMPSLMLKNRFYCVESQTYILTNILLLSLYFQTLSQLKIIINCKNGMVFVHISQAQILKVIYNAGFQIKNQNAFYYIIIIRLILLMKTTSSRHLKQYSYIHASTRIQLIKLVIKNHISISKAASTLSLSLSTAKLIIKRYKLTGTIFQRKNQSKYLTPPQQKEANQLLMELAPQRNAQNIHQNTTQIQNTTTNPLEMAMVDGCEGQIWYYYPYVDWDERRGFMIYVNWM